MKMDIRNTKIYFGNDAVLGEQIFKKLKKLGVDSQNKDQITFYFIPFRKNWLKQGKIQQILHS